MPSSQSVDATHFTEIKKHYQCFRIAKITFNKNNILLSESNKKINHLISRSCTFSAFLNRVGTAVTMAWQQCLSDIAFNAAVKNAAHIDRDSDNFTNDGNRNDAKVSKENDNDCDSDSDRQQQ